MRYPRRSILALGALGGAGLIGCKRAPHRLVYVSAEGGGEIVVVDPDKGDVVAHIPVGKRPRGLKLSHDSKLLYVALSGSPRAGPGVDEATLPPADRAADGIGLVDIASRKLLRVFPSGQDPEAFDLSLDGKALFVSNEETAELSVLDLAAGAIVAKVPVGEEPEGVTVRPDGKVVYVTSEEQSIVTAVDTERRTVLARMPTGRRPRSIVFSRDGATAFVTAEVGGAVTVLDSIAHRPIATIAIPGKAGVVRPMGAALSPDGSRLFVSTGRGGSVAIIDVARRQVTGTIGDVGARPWGIAVSRDGKWLYSANGPSDDVSVIDVGARRVVRRIATGGLPWGLVVAES